jgi:serine protease Do
VYTESRVSDDIATSRQNAITRAVKTCSPAIVGINVTEVREQVYRDPFDMFSDPFFEQFFGRRQQRTYKRQYEVRGLGSGFLISKDGYIVTNDHVAGNASKVVVTLTNGEKYDAEIIGTDPTTDVALLKIKGDDFPYLKLANSDDVMVGEWAIAFGNPFGLFDINAKPTVTVGVVSNTDVDFTQPDQSVERVYRGMIQTDAAISSGNSGGPLVNANGDVIGVNTVIYSTAQSYRGAGSIGIGFSIPINRVKQVVDRLKKGAIDRDFWTGMTVRPIDEQSAAYFRLKRATGVMVEQVYSNSPADDAGIEPGDVILSIDGHPVVRDEDVSVAILDGEVGTKLKVKLLRGDTEKEVTLTLRQRPRSGSVRN